MVWWIVSRRVCRWWWLGTGDFGVQGPAPQAPHQPPAHHGVGQRKDRQYPAQRSLRVAQVDGPRHARGQQVERHHQPEKSQVWPPEPGPHQVESRMHERYCAAPIGHFAAPTARHAICPPPRDSPPVDRCSASLARFLHVLTARQSRPLVPYRRSVMALSLVVTPMRRPTSLAMIPGSDTTRPKPVRRVAGTNSQPSTE